jgi:hypothetical protein
MSNGTKQEQSWPAIGGRIGPQSWEIEESPSGRNARAAADAEHALTVAEGVLDAVRAANDPASWEARRRELEQAVAISARTLESALRGAGPHELGALEFRLADVVRTMEALRPPASFGPVALEAEIIAALAVKPAGAALTGHARKEAVLDALLRRLGVADSRALVARIEKRIAGDALVDGFQALAVERRVRLLATLRGAARREAQAGEAARRAALAAAKVTGVPAEPVAAKDEP